MTVTDRHGIMTCVGMRLIRHEAVGHDTIVTITDVVMLCMQAKAASPTCQNSQLSEPLATPEPYHPFDNRDQQPASS